jgi:hypothetical protein
MRDERREGRTGHLARAPAARLGERICKRNRGRLGFRCRSVRATVAAQLKTTRGIMPGWTKLHSRIVKSSIWSAPDHVRILWITMLAEADAEGFVDSSVPGLKQMANLTLEQTEEALKVLEGPDPYTSDDSAGERIIKTPGGWWIKNHRRYRDVRTKQQENTAERVRRCRERKRQGEEPAQSVTCNNVTPGNDPQQKVTSGSVPASSSSSSSSSSSLLLLNQKRRRRAGGLSRPSNRTASPTSSGRTGWIIAAASVRACRKPSSAASRRRPSALT